MPLSNPILKQLIITEMEALGLGSDNPSQHEKLAEAIAKAVVQHITSAAQVNIPSGSSAGVYGVS